MKINVEPRQGNRHDQEIMHIWFRNEWMISLIKVFDSRDLRDWFRGIALLWPWTKNALHKIILICLEEYVII